MPLITNREFADIFNVSRETMEYLEIYAKLLTQWQQNLNLVSATTLPQLWHRHMADSAQLAELIPQDIERLVDFGSGAGFPALVLACLRPDLTFDLIDSDRRKTIFMNEVIRQTGLNKAHVRVHNVRVEAWIESYDSVNRLDHYKTLVVSRAFAKFDKLLAYTHNLFEKQTIRVSETRIQLIGLGGRQIKNALTAFKENGYIDYSLQQSRTATDAYCFIIRENSNANPKAFPS